MKLIAFLLGMTLVTADSFSQTTATTPADQHPLNVKKCNDFTITGSGNDAEWQKTNWTILPKLDSGGHQYKSRFKIMYSAKGIYLLFHGEDSTITTTYDKDFGDLYNADVFEAFFHPNPQTPVYFEYEINQLNKELVLMVPNNNGDFYGWIPWHYENQRRTKKLVNIKGGKMESGAHLTSWDAEIFFPYELFKPLEKVPPKSGTVWNANFYRIYYDKNRASEWAWKPVKKNFHDYQRFGQIQFE
jgi:hypothetical protein